MWSIGKVPVIAVMNHQQMLSSVNDSGASRLINIDEHSDLADRNVDRLECGTWISYVNWRRQGTYIWIRPKIHYYGSCNGNDWGLWNQGTDGDRSESRYIDSKNLRVTTYLYDCVGVGLCMSPAYAIADVANVFRDIVKKYGIPYREGLMHEKNRRMVRPSQR